MVIVTRFQNKQQMITEQLLFIPLFLKCQHNWEVISSYPPPRVCLKNSENDIFPEPTIDRLLSRLITFIW